MIPVQNLSVQINIPLFGTYIILSSLPLCKTLLISDVDEFISHCFCFLPWLLLLCRLGYLPEKWFLNQISYPSNRSKQMQKLTWLTVPAHNMLKAKFNWKMTHMASQTIICLRSHVYCFLFKLWLAYCVSALAVWVSLV